MLLAAVRSLLGSSSPQSSRTHGYSREWVSNSPHAVPQWKRQSDNQRLRLISRRADCIIWSNLSWRSISPGPWGFRVFLFFSSQIDRSHATFASPQTDYIGRFRLKHFISSIMCGSQAVATLHFEKLVYLSVLNNSIRSSRNQCSGIRRI